MLFGRGQEEISFLQKQGIKVEVVPGVSAALAASADLGVSLTHRGTARTVAFVTPRVAEGEQESGWLAAALAADTTAIYMGASEAQANASLPNVRVVHGTLEQLGEIAAQREGGPALLLIGEIFRQSAFTRGAQVSECMVEPALNSSAR